MARAGPDCKALYFWEYSHQISYWQGKLGQKSLISDNLCVQTPVVAGFLQMTAVNMQGAFS